MFGKVRAWSARRGRLMDALRVAPVAVLCLLPAVPQVFYEPGGVTGYVFLTLVLLAPLFVWWRRPVAAFAGVALVSFGQWAASVDVLPANFVVLVALWAVAARSSFRWALAALLVAELGVFLALVRWDTPTLGMFTTGSILVVTVWLAGLYASTRRRYLESLEERARRAELERDQRAKMAAAAERARIARELHDVVAHHVSVMVVQADGAGYAIASDPEQARLAVRTISRTGREALAEMRRLVGVLREDEGAGGGTDYTPQPGLAQLEDLVRGAGVPATLRVTGTPGELPEGVQLAVYRIVQEALTNALKHGGPDARALVELDCRGSELVVRVTDDGRGAAAPLASGGHGLVGMRERVGMYGGEVTAGPRPGGGFEVLARLPVPRVRAA
ncbi:sensor histidine kinase [Nonomuraea sp. NPDC050478]|uniref:sensor histidine kinase n=1 Tax=unclassified Nonomuraea TaxID=2593643 RepID=UPI0011CEB50A|nr:sensor histidine kinase [Nonomuraea sp. C10]TXK43057.1 sensor histidine kinase [Nonomuraea sp. C10]